MVKEDPRNRDLSNEFQVFAAAASRVVGTKWAFAAAIALIVSAISDVVHEGIGHGCVSILVGGKPQYLSSMNYVGDHRGLPIWSTRMVSAGGTPRMWATLRDSDRRTR